MSQLYSLKRGGVGSYNDYCEEQYIIMMEHLIYLEIMLVARLLAKIPCALFANENEILTTAAENLTSTKSAKTPICDLNKNIKEIAYVLRLKLHNGTESSRLTARSILDSFVRKAKNRGFKDADNFFGS